MIIIKNGTVHDGTGHVFQHTDILIDQGKIARIAENIHQDNARVIDATGQHVLPGFIDGASTWGTSAGRGQAAENDEATDPVTPHMEVMDAFDSRSMMYQELWGYGITSAAVLPTDKNVIGGYGAIFKTWGKDTESMCVRNHIVMRASVNENPKKTYGSRNVEPMTKMGIYSLIRQWLDKVSSDKKEDQEDIRVKALKPVYEGKIPLMVSCNTGSEIQHIQRALSGQNVRLILSNAYELDENLSDKVEGIVLGDLTDGFNANHRNMNYSALFALVKKGMPVALSAFSGTGAPGREILLWNAHGLLAKARGMKENIDSEDVLKMLTSNAAKICSVQDRTGSIREGLDADVVIWTGDPLKTFQALPKTVIISGEIVKGEE